MKKQNKAKKKLSIKKSFKLTNLSSIGLILAVAAVASLGAGYFSKQASAATVVPKSALIYGDSLTWESTWEINNVFAPKKGWTVNVHSFPATAPCDWLGWLPTDLATYHPTVVSFTSAGNPSSNCMTGDALTIGTDAYYAKYTQDINDMFAQVTATGAKFVYIAGPPFGDPVRDAAVIKINAIAKQLAANYHGVSYSNAARVALSKNNKYTDYLPCLRTETAAQGCSNGLIAIRTLTGLQAGLHLCPQGLPSDFPWFCTTYSSGEFRYGRAIANTTATPPKPILP